MNREKKSENFYADFLRYGYDKTPIGIWKSPLYIMMARRLTDCCDQRRLALDNHELNALGRHAERMQQQ
jgi:hypothetical protein